MDLFVRITESYDTLAGFIEKLSESCDKLIVYQHEGNRIHVHFYAVNCVLKTDSIKARIKKHLHVTSYDKSNWSFKSADDSGCITYMSKGTLEPCFVKGFTQEEVLEYKDRWVDRTPETSESKKSTAPSQYSMSMEVYSVLESKYKDRSVLDFHNDETYVSSQYAETEIFRTAMRESIKVCHKHGKGFDRNYLFKIATPAFTRFLHCRESFVESCVNSFFRY